MKTKLILVVTLFFLMPFLVLASVTESTNYRITVDNFGFAGDDGTSENYGLQETIGEPIVGVGTSESYGTQSGFWYKENVLMSVILDTTTEDLGTLIPGTPNTGETVVSVTTDCVAGYDLSVTQDSDMTHTDTVTTISGKTVWDQIANSGDGNAVAPYSGTGLGFGVVSSTANKNTTWWGTGTTCDDANQKYAGFPSTGASNNNIVEHNSYSLNATDTTVCYKVDVPSTQKSGTYSNTITYTAITNL